MKIIDIETIVLEISGDVEGHAFRRDWGVVRVHTDEGITGLSRASAGTLAVGGGARPGHLRSEPPGP